MATPSNSNGGIGFPGALALIFITLKLLDIAPIATWSWVWVLSPLWIGFSIVLLVVGIVTSVTAIQDWREHRALLKSFRADD